MIPPPNIQLPYACPDMADSQAGLTTSIARSVMNERPAITIRICCCAILTMK